MLDQILNFLYSKLDFLFVIILAVVVYELLKLGVRKSVGFAVRHKPKTAIIFIILAVVLLLIFREWG